jgi:hypothetical protein
MTVSDERRVPQSAGAARFVRRHMQFHFTISFNDTRGVNMPVYPLWQLPTRKVKNFSD